MSRRLTMPSFWEFCKMPMGWLEIVIIRRFPFISVSWKKNPDWQPSSQCDEA